MTRLETIRRFNLISSLIDTISAGATTWLGVKFCAWSMAVGKGVGKIAESPTQSLEKDEAVKLVIGIVKAGGMFASGLLAVVLVICAIIAFVVAFNLIIPAVTGFIAVARARKSEDPRKSVKIIRTADIVRLVFHSIMMIGAVIIVIIAIYNGAFGFAIIMAVLVSTIPAILSILSLVWQGKMKGATVDDDQMKLDKADG